ncbi:MAG: LuxR C-terminal-related transcriptional regulator [Methylotenera sp.]|nr:LuxR C-terminal-related transcriptional regulator [Methylotenera sp.]
MDKKHWEDFFEVVRACLSVNDYAQFGVWLQTKLTIFLPHQMMVHYWGDFRSKALTREITLFNSNKEMATLKDTRVFNEAAKALYDKWLSNNSRWFMLNYADPLFAQIHFDGNPEFQSLQHQSVLVYGVREESRDDACLYIFLCKEPSIVVDHYVIGMLMPYLVGALRRIKGFASTEPEEEYPSLSDREVEIMDWVNKGKSNYEIGEILSISHNTVKNHLKTIFKKLNVFSRAQAVSKFSMQSRQN